MTINKIRHINQISLKGKRVFLRLDLNVPIDQKTKKIEDDSRIQEALPTIKYAIENGARLIIASHLGRPNGSADSNYSLEPVATHLAGLLDQDVMLADDCIGEGIELLVQSLKDGEILLLENLRFHKGETGNKEKFVAKMTHLADVFITDAFGTAHRKHASTYGLPSQVESKGYGFLIEKELAVLDVLLNKPTKPFHLVLGGAKVTDKVKVIESLLRNIDGLFIGGAMAYAFMTAKGESLPANAKLPSKEDTQSALRILTAAKKKGIPVYLPVDTIDSYDIGPQTIELFCDKLKSAKTIFWNGPLGWFEKDEYAKGTHLVAQSLSQVSANKIIGGGDTVSAIKKFGLESSFEHLSTGGGASLEYLKDGSLPGIEILKAPFKKTRSSFEWEEEEND